MDAPDRPVDPQAHRLAWVLARPGLVVRAGLVGLVASFLLEWAGRPGAGLLVIGFALAWGWMRVGQRAAAHQRLAIAAIDAVGAPAAVTVAIRTVRSRPRGVAATQQRFLAELRSARWLGPTDCRSGHQPLCVHRAPPLPATAPGWWPDELAAALFDPPAGTEQAP